MEVPRSLAGTRFGPYEVRSLLGRGGMGEVYEAFDTSRDRVVALKVLPEQLAMDPAYEDRFHRETQAVAGLAEPHIVPVHDSGEIRGVLFVDMRLVRGESLRTLLRRQGALAPDRAVAIIEQVAAALDAAHAAGLTHRDVKPANVLVTPSDFAYLADFGIARSDGESAVTTAGHAAGTYTYMAPERFDSGQITARADTYSLACVFYECLTGMTPFSARSVNVLIRSHLSEPPPRPSAERSYVPASFDAVITRAMAKAPADRYQTAGQFAAAARSALAAGARAAETNAVIDPPTTIFGAELLADPPPAAEPPPTAVPSPSTVPSPGPTASEVAAAAASDYRREPDPTTFQPFGPQGPTIAARFQPRSPDNGDAADASQTGTPAEATPDSGPTPAAVNSTAAQPVPESSTRPGNGRAGVPPAAAPGYETTGTLRIIAPAGKDERDTTGDLPVIRPSGATSSVKSGEFHFTPPHEERSAPRVPATGRQAPTPVRPAAESTRAHGGYDAPGTGDEARDPEPGNDPRTQLLDPTQFRTEPRTDSRSGYGADSRAPGAEAAATSAGDTQFLDVSRLGAGTGGDTQFLDIAGLHGERGYDDGYGEDHSDRAHDDPQYDDYDRGYDDSGYHDPAYRDADYDPDYRDPDYRGTDYHGDDYRDGEYDDSDEGVIRRYEDDLRYAEPATHADDEDGEFAFAAADYDEAPSAKRPRSVAVPLVLGFLGAAVIAGIGVVGWQVFGSSSSTDRPATTAAAATAGPRSAAPVARPTTTGAPTTTTTTGSAAALPVGASSCPQTSSSESTFGKTATGSSVTSCGFAEAVRQAYAETAESHGATSAASADANTSIIAVSPVTGRSYPMTCTSSGKVVTCTGGDNAVVYVY